MLYRLPSAIYVECRDLELEARGIIAIANALRDWYFTKQAELLQYLNTGDTNIRHAILSDVFKHDTTHGSLNPKQVIADFDNIMEQFMQHDEEQDKPDEYTRLANTPWHYDEPDAKPKDDTVAEGLPHRTHDTNTPWPYDHGLFRPCCQADDD